MQPHCHPRPPVGHSVLVKVEAPLVVTAAAAAGAFGALLPLPWALSLFCSHIRHNPIACFTVYLRKLILYLLTKSAKSIHRVVNIV